MKKAIIAFAVLLFAIAAAAQTTTFTVTTNADSGPGTLREAIIQANARCDGSMLCEIRFARPLYLGVSIEPLSPLPAITSCAITIGEPAIAENAGNRAVELSGVRLHPASGSGFEVRARCPVANAITIRNFAITGFPDNGVQLSPPSDVTHGPSGPDLHIESNNIGIDTTGIFERRNGWRGIVLADDAATATIEGNIISGNGRSGIFMWSAAFVSVHDNTFGLSRNGFPRPNGASGIYVGWASARITHNTIAFSRDFGVAISPAAPRVSVTENSLFENGWLGIDWALNGRIDNELPDDAVVPLPPTVTSVNGQTVQGVAHVRAKETNGVYRILLYSTEAWRQHAEGEHFVGALTIAVPHDGKAHDVPFELRAAPPLFDTVITAQASVSPTADELDVNTSELSAGVRYSCCR